MIRLLVSDIDGTLVTKEKELTAQVREAAEDLAAHDIKLVLVSSRPLPGVSMFADALGLQTPRASLNGGVITSADGEILRVQAMDEDAACEAIAYLQSEGIAPWLFTADAWLLTDPDGDYVSAERRSVGLEYRVVADLAPHAARAGKIMAASREFARLRACEEELQRRLAGRVSAHRSQDHYLDITHPLANKGEAVRETARLLGIPLANTACIGDMSNDLPMFDVATYKIAMGNAPAAMQARADYVTATNQESGWAQAVQDYILPHNAKG